MVSSAPSCRYPDILEVLPVNEAAIDYYVDAMHMLDAHQPAAVARCRSSWRDELQQCRAALATAAETRGMHRCDCCRLLTSHWSRQGNPWGAKIYRK